MATVIATLWVAMGFNMMKANLALILAMAILSTLAAMAIAVVSRGIIDEPEPHIPELSDNMKIVLHDGRVFMLHDNTVTFI